MKTRVLEKIYAFGLLFIFAGIVLHAPFSVYFGTLFPSDTLLIKSWKEIIMLLLMPIATLLVTRHRLWREFSRDWLFRLIIAYAVLHLILSAVLFNGTQPTLAGLAIDLRYVLFFSLVYTLLRIAPRYKRPILYIGCIGALVVLGFAVLQLFLPADILSHIGYSEKTIQPYLTVDKNPDYIRVNSTLRGPNPLGVYAATAVALVLAFALRKKLRLSRPLIYWTATAIAVFGAIALWISYSRSSIIALAIACAIIISVVGIKRMSKRAWQIIGVTTVMFVIFGLAVAQQSHFISNVVLHENPVGGSSVSSNEGHAESLVVNLGRLIQQPFGDGIGSTGSASLLAGERTIIENQYLFIAHEAGWLGLALYVGIAILIYRRLWWRRTSWLGLGLFASGVGIAVIGIIQPVWVDDTVSILWWGLAAVAIIGEKSHGRSTTEQKTT